MKRIGLIGGLTLIELMIALAISSVLMLGFVQVFSHMKSTYLKQNKLIDWLIKKDQFIVLMMNLVHNSGQVENGYIEDPVLPYIKDITSSHFSILRTEFLKEFSLHADITKYVSVKFKSNLRKGDVIVFSDANSHEINEVRSFKKSRDVYRIELSQEVQRGRVWQSVALAQYYQFELRDNALYLDPGIGRYESILDGVESIQLNQIMKDEKLAGLRFSLHLENHFQSPGMHRLAQIQFISAFKRVHLDEK